MTRIPALKQMLRPWLLAAVVFAAGPAAADVDPDDLARVRMPPGFAIQVFARVPRARSLVPVPDLGVVFVSTRADTVYAVFDRDWDGKAEGVVPVARGLKVANGIAWREGYLYVAEQHRLVRFPARAPLAPPLGDPPGTPQVLFSGLPDKRSHGWRDAAVAPDGSLYVAVGSPCNICMPRGLEGTVLRFAPPFDRPQVFARGIRNSVGLAFHPETGELFFTDNGADNMGDDLPPDELNHAPRAGMHFGYPWYGGGDARTPHFRDEKPPADAVPPVVAFGAHVAALGLHFYRGAMFPAGYRTDAFVAQHGSWNRTEPDGYRLMRIRMDAKGRVLGAEKWAEGWLLEDGGRWGRPVDVAEHPDGSLLVSDDYAGVVYRITYSTP